MISNFNVCGCSKWTQNFNTDREYIDEYKKVKINIYDKKNNEFWKYNIEKNNINNKIKSKKKESDCIKTKIIILNNEINSLDYNIINYYNQKNQINKLNKNVLDMIFRLKNIETKISDICNE